MDLIQFFKCLSDLNRLTCLCLIHRAGEACVCEIQEALNLEQPKISQYLAQLRKCGILQSERRGRWVYYRFSPDLPSWAFKVITTSVDNNAALFEDAIAMFDNIHNSGSACNDENNKNAGE